MLMLLAMLVSAPPPTAQADVAKKSVRDAVCTQTLAAVPGDRFSLMAFAGPGRRNETGVLLLVNCSDRKIVSVRDPSTSRRHLTKFVYAPGVRRQLRRDPDSYEFLNFNERPNNSAMEVTSYSRETYWRGPCRFDGLKLTTIDPRDDQDRRTITFSVNVCENHVLALVRPPEPATPPLP